MGTDPKRSPVIRTIIYMVKNLHKINSFIFNRHLLQKQQSSITLFKVTLLWTDTEQRKLLWIHKNWNIPHIFLHFVCHYYPKLYPKCQSPWSWLKGATPLLQYSLPEAVHATFIPMQIQILHIPTRQSPSYCPLPTPHHIFLLWILMYR